jgi:hypothetical protein
VIFFNELIIQERFYPKAKIIDMVGFVEGMKTKRLLSLNIVLEDEH